MLGADLKLILWAITLIGLSVSAYAQSRVVNVPAGTLSNVSDSWRGPSPTTRTNGGTVRIIDTGQDTRGNRAATVAANTRATAQHFAQATSTDLVHLKCELVGQCGAVRSASDDMSCPSGWAASNGTYRLSLSYKDHLLHLEDPHGTESKIPMTCSSEKCDGLSSSEKFELSFKLDRTTGQFHFTKEYKLKSSESGRWIDITHLYDGTCIQEKRIQQF